MTRWARKVDGNHTELVRQLRALGVFVHDMSRVGGRWATPEREMSGSVTQTNAPATTAGHSTKSARLRLLGVVRPLDRF